ncbi:unnamed protein product [Brachionus calyciflorus]|uniref:Epoxide hydrolase N-terminal domain-containing protein n=1 Tax=Brachionus calyciflorus TaxID=104777 RepID=A0A813NPT0_9BILA|nr:unnamed protein product [Brachionus calyciflorus]
MPVLQINTNIRKENFTEKFNSNLVDVFAQTLNKPKEFCVLHVLADQLLTFAGTSEPCAYVILMSIGQLGVEENKKHSKAIMDELEKIGIPPNRMYIVFNDSHPSQSISSKLSNLPEWAQKEKVKIDVSKTKPEKFRVEFDEKEWNFLKQKLSLTRYFTPLKDVPKFDYGFDPEYAKELIDYWNTKFDWKSQVDFLNKYPQFRVNINDTILHYVHYVTNPSAEKKVNLLLLDGWPGSFFGFYKMIDFIDQNYKDTSYNIIVPSIPGYGYSNPLNKKSSPLEASLIFNSLMEFLCGENVKYYVHGEDWGSIIATILTQLFPQRISGIHITLPLVSETGLKNLICLLFTPIFPSYFLTDKEMRLNYSVRYPLRNKIWTLWDEFGYFHLQSTRPDTIGHGLTDSPVGLMAFILEKYSFWSFNKKEQISGRKDGGLNNFDKNYLLTIITMYWMSNSITSSMRFYANAIQMMLNFRNSNLDFLNLPTPKNVPVSVQTYINEIFVIPKRVIETKYANLVRYNIFENGGHFASFQNPENTTKDFIEFIMQIELNVEV